MVAWLALGCGSPGPSATGPERPSHGGSTPAPAPADTGAPPHSGAPPLQASCEPTDNALRFLCRVSVDPPQAVRIRYRRADGQGPERSVSSPGPSAEHELVLVFLPELTEHEWVAETEVPGGPEARGAFATGRVPDLARSALEVSGSAGVALVGAHQPCNASATATIYDTDTGALVWYHTLDPVGRLGLLEMVSFTEDHTVLGNTGVSVVEVDLAGRTRLHLRRGVDYTEELHHDLLRRAGFVYALHHDQGTGDPGDPLLDGFLVFDGRTGARVATWRPREHLDLPPDAAGDFLHLNTVAVDAAGDVLLSSRSRDTVFAVAGDWTSPDFGARRWSLAGGSDTLLGDDLSLDWSAVDGEDAFGQQHHARPSGEGRLLLLDNPRSRALELTYDPTAGAGAVERSWAGPPGWCGAQGTAARTSDGHVFVGCSPDGALLDHGPDGAVVWRARAVCEFATFSTVARYTPLEGW